MPQAPFFLDGCRSIPEPWQPSIFKGAGFAPGPCPILRGSGCRASRVHPLPCCILGLGELCGPPHIACVAPGSICSFIQTRAYVSAVGRSGVNLACLLEVGREGCAACGSLQRCRVHAPIRALHVILYPPVWLRGARPACLAKKHVAPAPPPLGQAPPGGFQTMGGDLPTTPGMEKAGGWQASSVGPVGSRGCRGGLEWGLRSLLIWHDRGVGISAPRSFLGTWSVSSHRHP